MDDDESKAVSGDESDSSYEEEDDSVEEDSAESDGGGPHAARRGRDDNAGVDEEKEAECDDTQLGASADSEDEGSDGERQCGDSEIEDRVAFLVNYNYCHDNCLASQAERTRNFSKAYMKMSKQCQRTCLVTTLSFCQYLSNAKSNRSQSPRTRYAYSTPVVGSVYKPAFQELFNISNDTLAKFRAKALGQDIGQDEVETNAEELPVSFRRQKEENGETVVYYVRVRYQLLPSFYTWEYLRDKHLKHAVNEKTLVAGKPPPKPSLSAFRAILLKEYLTIKIRSPRDNVCDQRVTCSNSLGATSVVGDTENMSTHVKEAVAMRRGRGGYWTIYVDNCGGQSKNNTTPKYSLFLALSKCVESVSINYLVKRHTKNHCDRGFGNLKRCYAWEDVWTMGQLGQIVGDLVTTNERENLEGNVEVFRDFKTPLHNLYKNINALQSYQLFSMSSSGPGVAHYHKSPESPGDKQNVLASTTPRTNFSAKQVKDFGDIYKKVAPFVPAKFRSDALYIVPTPEDMSASSPKKRGRVTKKSSNLPEKRCQKLLAARKERENEEQKE